MLVYLKYCFSGLAFPPGIVGSWVDYLYKIYVLKLVGYSCGYWLVCNEIAYFVAP